MSRRRFAEGTKVPPERSRAEIERLVRKRGARSFGSYTTPEGTSILFEIRNRRIRFVLPLPKGTTEREECRRWRCLLLSVKAKFEAVDSGIVSFDEEFLAHIVVPDSEETVGSRMGPAIAAAYERGVPLLTQ